VDLAARSRLWAYPWDVADAGVDGFRRDVAVRAGVGGVSLAASYHAGYFLQPHNARARSYFPEDGTVYFHPDPGRWDRLAIRPQPAALLSEADPLGELLRERDDSGLRVTCWTVCLHNSRLGTRHPDATVEDAFGNRRPFALCPSHPDVRAYVTTLVADLTRERRPDAVELETPGFLGFVHGHHHEKDGVGLTPEDDVLLSFCFCACCLDRARMHGVDGDAARSVVRGWLEESFARAEPRARWPSIRETGPAVFADHPAVHQYAVWRSEPVTSLVADIRDAMHPDTRLDVIIGPAAWTQGMDVAELTDVCDGFVFCAYDRSVPQVGSVVESFVAEAKGRPVNVGLRVFMPEQGCREDFISRVGVAAAAGASGLNFYNYGLIPLARLDWINDALRG
jgi:hypothetical protein